MTPKTAADILNGCEYREEVSNEFREQLKKNLLVVIYGASDDIIEIDGAISDETYGPGTFYLNRSGLVNLESCPKCGRSDEHLDYETFEAIWDDQGYSWTYKTNIPHETFDVLEDGEKYCRGIVFCFSDLPIGNK